MRLTDCFADLLGFALETRNGLEAGAGPGYDEVRSQVEQLLAEASATCSGGKFSPEQFEAAKFAVVAFIDEVLLSADWPGQEQWARSPLQRAHFGTANAGEELFARLDALNPFNPAENDIREVYFYCLSLGFTGRYEYSGGKAKLAELRSGLFESLARRTESGTEDGDRLFPGADPAPMDSPGVHASASWLPVYVGIPLLLLIGAYIFFRMDLVQTAESLLRTV
ncbi:DotU family type IV/VI secretion system protein [Thiohalorhabdus methylotrophus]|uniref:DotU family type IV/VI secretion system protein n=1 Tax=Thiohalorhabdus methylotrophus TaxID=3242694 RepID=A0ABV4TSG5_9GAMM